MPDFEVRKYNPNDIDPAKANWKLEGINGDWEYIEDPVYGRIDHVNIFQDNNASFDKIDIALKPGAYVLPVRINPVGKAEFLIPTEKRMLLPDEEGKRGNVMIPNIPQGLILEGERPHEAARRRLLAETGYDKADLVGLEKMYFAPSNSSAPMYFFMGVVQYEQTPVKQNLEADQVIEIKPWMNYQQVRAIRHVQDGSTRIALDLATQWLRSNLL